MLGVLAKLAYAQGMTEMELLPVRFVFATGLLLGFLLLRSPRLLRVRAGTLARCAGLGLGLFCVQSTLFFKSLALLPASTAILIIYCSPVGITLGAAAFFGLRPGRAVRAALVAVTAGCALVCYDAFTRAAPWQGLVLAGAAMALWCVYALALQVVLRNEHPLTVTFYVFAATALGFLVIGEPSVLLRLTAPRLVIGVLIGLVPTVLALGLLFTAIERIGSAHASLFASVEPVATTIAAWALLDESVAWLQALGAACILAGVALPTLAPALGRRFAASRERTGLSRT
jgi:drug/metabolite transporter (DMT)-like permease